MLGKDRSILGKDRSILGKYHSRLGKDRFIIASEGSEFLKHLANHRDVASGIDKHPDGTFI